MLLHDYRSYIECQQRVGLRFIGTGISGGEEGARHGLPVPAIASALSYSTVTAVRACKVASTT